jgi:pyruvate dehydrogenase E2 component (dihydrolipoamide acetyltransferase)
VAVEIRLPPLGQTSDEMIVVEWYRQPGDAVREGEPLLSVETDKVTVDVEAAAAGTLLDVLVQPGDLVEAGTVIARIGAADEAAAEPSAPPPQPVVPQALPAVRQLAREHGVDLGSLRGSGPDGRIERADVLAAASAGEGSNATPAMRLQAVPPARAAMARRLTDSVQRIPQFTVTVSCDVAAARTLIAALREDGVRVGLTHVATRALARALREHPEFNRLWVDDGPSYRLLEGAPVGVAVATEDAVVVVTVEDADRLEWPQLCADLEGAAARARCRTAVAADRRPAAITLSNLGMHDVDGFRAIVDRDQTAIAAMGSVRATPNVVDGELVVSDMVVINLTADHRVVDGVHAARFAATLRSYIEDPSRLDSVTPAEAARA